MKSTLLLSLAALAAFGGDIVTLDSVNVTASGMKERNLDQPLSINTKEKKEIELDQVVYQKDLLNSISGVRIEQTGSVIGHMTAIRMPINTGPYYLFMQDGIPVQSSGFFNHNGLAYTTFQSATNVEVLKGAGSALYGSDAIAAVINVNSLAKPSKKQEITFRAKGGSFGYGSGFAEISDSTQNGGYRANINYMHSDGWREHTKTDRLELNSRYDYEISDDTDVKFILNASKTEAQQADSFNNYENITNGSTKASDDPNYYTALEKTDVTRKFDFARLSAEFSNYTFDDLEMKFTPYVRYNRNRYVATWEGNLPSNDNQLSTIGFIQRNTYEQKWGKVVFGFDTEYTHSTLQYNQDFDVNTTGWNPKVYTQGALYDYAVDYFALAPYLHVDYKVTKKMLLSVGARYDYNRYDYDNKLQDNSTDSSNTYFRPADRTDSFHHLSPKLALVYKPQKDFNIYARYANGFRIPQATRLYSVKVGYENIELKPETSNTFEMGVKKEFEKKSYFEIAVYYMSIDDTIIRDSATGGYRNGNSSIHEGVETTLKTKINEEFSTKLAYSYSKHFYKDDAVLGNNEIAQAPNHLANARLFYTPKRLDGLKVMAEWQYVGPWYMDDAHTVEKYDGYNIGNLKGEYAYSKKLKFFAKVNNITDKKYAVSARYAYHKEDYTPGDPRSYYGGIEYKW